MKKFTLLSITMMLVGATMIAQDPVPASWEVIQNPLTEGNLPMTASGQSIFGDYNNDGILDYFVIAGQQSAVSALYKGNSNGTFTEVLTDISALSFASAVFFDYDNDGNLDLLICGSVDGTTTAAVTELYHNSGAPNYTFNWVETAPFIGISAESGDNNTHLFEVVDYNNDGWLDVFMTGNHGATWETSGTSRVVALYKNNGGTFELQKTPVDGTTNFLAINGGSIHAGDINNDGYADMVVTGYYDGTIQTITTLYVNQKDGTFKSFPDTRTVFRGHQQGETFFVDINNDGWMDIAEIGRDVNSGWASFAHIHINNKDLTFTKSTTSGLIGGQAVATIGDINNDGKMDIAVSGWGPNMTFFYNKGDNTFLAKPIEPDMARARAGNIILADITGDGNLDFSVFGYRDGGGSTPDNPTWPHFLLKNMQLSGANSNTPPTIPTNVTATANADKVVLNWNKSTDDTTPADAIRYNIYVKNKTTGKVFTYYPVDIANGKLKAMGGIRPFISGTSITLQGVNTTDYEFGVQAVDNGFHTSAFQMVATGLADNELSKEVMITSNEGRIKLVNSSNKTITFTVFEVNGKTIQTGECAPMKQVDSQSLAKGVYLIKLTDGTNVMGEKVIIM